MKELLHINIPYLGRLYAQWDTITPSRIEIEALVDETGCEYLICLGRLRAYITSAKTLANERAASASAYERLFAS
ncbi:hypothetical protein [Aliiroseovarius marinus]|uniref:hypothetical protein n=1 Tax=Aliiroseovarius marinus TaxID=2500159 RepID=UPI003D7EEDB1